MTRPRKSTVDYFPHTVQHGKTMFILESKWGNDGYATWFKILEHLGSSENHIINLNDDAEAAYLAACCKIDVQKLFAILDQCSAVNAIQQDFWRKKLIYSTNFIQNIADAYRKRLEKLLTEQELKNLYKQYFPEDNEFPAEENHESDGYPAEETHKGKGKGKGKVINIPPISPLKGGGNKPSKELFLLPDYIPEETWTAYLEVRKKKRAAKTPYALNLVIKELERIQTEHGHDPIDVLNKSITSGWSDVYPLKDRPSTRKEACER